jgi:hypothetical protein
LAIATSGSPAQPCRRTSWIAPSFATFAANTGDLWFPAMDDLACVLSSAGQLLVLVLDHEELITPSRLGASPAARHSGQAGHERGVRDGWPGWSIAGSSAGQQAAPDTGGPSPTRDLRP